MLHLLWEGAFIMTGLENNVILISGAAIPVQGGQHSRLY